MRNAIRFVATLFVLASAVACGSSDDPQARSQPPQGNARTTNAPSGGSQAAPVPAAPIMMPMDVPSGTELNLTLETPVSSETSRPEQPIRARVADAVVISGMTVIAEGALVAGIVIAAERSGRVKGRASVAIRFNRVTVADTPYTIDTASIVREAEATKGEATRDKEITIPAGTMLRTTIQETVRITAPM